MTANKEISNKSGSEMCYDLQQGQRTGCLYVQLGSNFGRNIGEGGFYEKQTG